MTFRRTTCAHCRKKFVAERPGQIVHAECAAAYAVAQRQKEERAAAKQAKAAAKVQRAQDRKRIDALRPLSWHKAQAQRALNAWIVHGRDKGRPCISCGSPAREGDQAGHYRSRGAAPHLALDPRNLARQCVRCNLHLHGNPIGFRLGLVAQHGEAFVQALECDQAPKKYTAADFDEIAANYRAKLKALTKERA